MRKAIGIAIALLLVTPAMAGGGSQIRHFLLNTGVQPAATGRVIFVSNPAQSQLRIKVSKLAPGTYDVVLDGAVVDTLVVDSKGKGVLQQRSLTASKKRPAIPLSFDPRGGSLSVELAGTIVLEGEVPETPEEGLEHVEIEADLDNLGVIAGEAEAEFEARNGHMEFEVEVEGVPIGDYDVLVDGVKVGSLHAGIDNEGSLEFDSVPNPGGDDDDEGEGELDNLLTFDPRGKTITIAQNGTDLFSTVFPTVSTGDDDDDDDQGEDDGGDDDDDDDDEHDGEGGGEGGDI